MYISASLPKNYGAFKKIQDDNYPFKRHFTQFLEAVVEIGLQEDLTIDELVGYIEDTLMQGERLPDIPKGNKVVTFRFDTDDESIIEYYTQQEMTNKDVTLMIVQMTLRLSARFGTSLPRLRTQLSNIDYIEAEPQEVIRIATPAKRPRPIEVKPVQPVETIKPVETPVIKPVETVKPVETPVVRPVVKPVVETEETTAERITRLNKRVENITADTSVEDEVVETNDALKDFIDLAM